MIRSATPEDIPRLIELGRLMHAESPEFSAMQFDPERLTFSIRAAMFSPLGFVRVADVAGLVVGGIVAMASPHYFSADFVTCDLALFVERQHRGGMTAARLIANYRDWGRALGAKKVQLGVMTGVDSEMVAGLCERLGARRAGVVMEF